MARVSFGPPREARRQAEVILSEFFTMSAEEYFGREIFQHYMRNVTAMSWSEAARELGKIVDVPVDARTTLALVAREVAAAKSVATHD